MIVYLNTKSSEKLKKLLTAYNRVEGNTRKNINFVHDYMLKTVFPGRPFYMGGKLNSVLLKVMQIVFI